MGDIDTRVARTLNTKSFSTIVLSTVLGPLLCICYYLLKQCISALANILMYFEEKLINAYKRRNYANFNQISDQIKSLVVQYQNIYLEHINSDCKMLNKFEFKRR